MGLRITLEVNRNLAEEPAATVIEAGTQTEVRRPLPEAPAGYEVAEAELPAVVDRSLRVYIVWSTVPGREGLVGVYWSTGTVAWHALQSAAGWGGLRRWHRTVVQTGLEARNEFEEGCAEGLPPACRVFPWT